MVLFLILGLSLEEVLEESICLIFCFFFRLSAFCWVVEDFISNLQYMLYRLQFALDMAGYLFVPFHSKSIVHVKNRVPSIAAINLLLQSTTTVILYTCHHSQ